MPLVELSNSRAAISSAAPSYAPLLRRRVGSLAWQSWRSSLQRYAILRYQRASCTAPRRVLYVQVESFAQAFRNEKRVATGEGMGSTRAEPGVITFPQNTDRSYVLARVVEPAPSHPTGIGHWHV
ncbi:hypothetical protein AURDEDRAFT_166680 [Auricularia subglabra TFB-10046 SS5]|nr:hypothetical protein AURDEDRAFT_166680 [Auricularia subglabra TFB-10046 SS5]